MSDFDPRIGRVMGVYALALGVLYLLFGLMEIVGVGGSGTDPIPIPGDLFGGLAILVVAATYLNGVRGLFRGEHVGLSFLIGALFLSAVFGVLYLLLMGADGLSYLIGSSDEFAALADFRPEIWFFLLSLPLAYQVWKLTREVTW